MTLVNAQDPQFERFGPLFKAVNEGSTNNYDALMVSDDVAGRSGLVRRLMQLFEAAWKTRKSETKQGAQAFQDRERPSQREFPDTIYREDLKAIMEGVSAAMPAPDDPDFADFLRSRIYGVFHAMAMLINLEAKTRRTSLVVSGANMLGQSAIDEGGIAQDIDSLSGDLRRAEMTRRVGKIRKLFEVPGFIGSNKRLLQAVNKKFEQFKEVVDEVFAAYRAKVSDFATNNPEFQRVQWFNTLLVNLNNFEPAEGNDIGKILRNLAITFENAQNAKQFTALINNFGKTK